MGCLRRVISLVGLLLLILGIGMLINLYLRPLVQTQKREVGGATVSQADLAEQTFGATYSEDLPPDLPLIIDGQASSTNSVLASPQIEDSALADISSVETGEVADANEIEVIPLTIEQFSSQSGQGGAGGLGQVEQRTVELEWTDSFAVEGVGTVKLTLKSLPDGSMEIVPEIPDNAVLSTPILITDRYATHIATVTARLGAPKFEVEEINARSQTLERGQEATWRWGLIAPDNTGEYILTLDLELVWTPRSGGDSEPARSIWGQSLPVEVNYVFGVLTVPQASIGGSVLAVLGFVSQFGWMVDIWKIFSASRRRRRQQRRQTAS